MWGKLVQCSTPLPITLVTLVSFLIESVQSSALQGYALWSLVTRVSAHLIVAGLVSCMLIKKSNLFTLTVVLFWMGNSTGTLLSPLVMEAKGKRRLV